MEPLQSVFELKRLESEVQDTIRELYDETFTVSDLEIAELRKRKDIGVQMAGLSGLAVLPSRDSVRLGSR